MKFKKNKELYIDLANCIRVLAADGVERANSGHPGMPLGMADIMSVLVFDFLKFNPCNPKSVNRDRLILSNGHGSMLLYAFYYLTGYKDFALEDLKKFRTLHSKTPGHPEYGAYPAIETTTGPLGQGFANAVGMAIASKKNRGKYGEKICNYKIYCIVGDGCLMEGISYEAASLAGHLALNNLIVIFDNNNITIDGRVSLSCSENQSAKFKALGWNTHEINGHNVDEIYDALKEAQSSNKPSFISCRTIIAKGAKDKEDSEKSHGSPLGQEVIKHLKETLNFPQEPFAVPDKLLKIWRSAWKKNELDFTESTLHKMSIEAFSKVDLINKLKNIKNTASSTSESTRANTGLIMSELLKICDKIICGSADLSISNCIKNDYTKAINREDFSGNFIHYGIREHAMAGIMNGLALEGFLPVGASFLIFSDYMRPAVRLAALMKLKVWYIFTHDSIGVGEDGPTHQPVEQLASLRLIPNLLVMRPANFAEALKCFEIAINYEGPVAFALTRQKINQGHECGSDFNLSTGAYIAKYEGLDQKQQTTEVTILASGSELQIALEVALILRDIKIRVVSVPCLNLLLAQDRSYIQEITGGSKLKVAIEAGSSYVWHKIIGENGIFFGVEKFGASAPSEILYKYFELEPQVIADRIKELILIQF